VRICTGVDNPANRLVTGHQRVTHAGEGRHPALPQKAFRAGTYPAPGDIDDNIGALWGRKRKRTHRKPLGLFEYDRLCVHASPSAPSAEDTAPLKLKV
jgi:hypothetical protein